MNLLDPCPYAECAAIGEHHHEIARGVVNPYPLPMECPRAAIADAREGLGPLPVEYWAEDDDFYWGDDYQDYDISEDDSPVWDGEFLKRHYYGK